MTESINAGHVARRFQSLGSRLFLSLLFSALFINNALPCLAQAHLQDVVIRKHGGLSHVAVHYPRIDGLPNSSVVNYAIKKLIKDSLSDASVEQSSEADQSSFTGTYKVSMMTPEVVSIRFVFENSVCNSRPLVTHELLNYSPKRGEDISLDDIFRKSVDYEELLEVLSLSNLVKEEDVSMIDSTTSESLSPEDFTLTKRGIDIHLGSEDAWVNACTMPAHTVHVPYACVRDLVSPSSPVYALAMQSSGPESGRKFTRANLKSQLGAVAIAAYTRAIGKNPDDPEVYRKRAKWHEQLGHKALAAADLASAAKLDSKLAMNAGTSVATDEPATSPACTENRSTEKPSTEATDQQAPLVAPSVTPPNPQSLALRLWLIGALLIVVAAACAIIKITRLRDPR